MLMLLVALASASTPPTGDYPNLEAVSRDVCLSGADWRCLPLKDPATVEEVRARMTANGCSPASAIAVTDKLKQRRVQRVTAAWIWLVVPVATPILLGTARAAGNRAEAGYAACMASAAK